MKRRVLWYSFATWCALLAALAGCTVPAPTLIIGDDAARDTCVWRIPPEGLHLTQAMVRERIGRTRIELDTPQDEV